MNTLLLIDGNPIMHRSYHAIPSTFISTDGTPTNVIYGFFSILHKLINDFGPEYVICCFDTPKPTFRNKIFKEYQAQRPKVDDNFITQIPLVKNGLKQAGIFYIEKDGYEADDLIGSVARIFNNDQYRIIIVSGDKDIMQLVNNNIFLATPQIGLNMKLYDQVEVERKLMIKPSQIPDYKALAGDPADNYPGAKGIGPVTAAKLINQFNSVEHLYDCLNEVASEKIKKLLIDNKDSVMLSKKLATIITDVPIDIDIEQMKFNGFANGLKDFLNSYQINSLANRIYSIKQPKKIDKPKEDQISLF